MLPVWPWWLSGVQILLLKRHQLHGDLNHYEFPNCARRKRIRRCKANDLRACFHLTAGDSSSPLLPIRFFADLHLWLTCTVSVFSWAQQQHRSLETRRLMTLTLTGPAGSRPCEAVTFQMTQEQHVISVSLPPEKPKPLHSGSRHHHCGSQPLADCLPDCGGRQPRALLLFPAIGLQTHWSL